MTKDILIVDDSAVNVRLLESILTSEGYAVSSADGGERALRLIAESRPDLILLDIMMPEMNGYVLCSRLKRDPQLKDIPIIFISALDGMEDKVRAFTVGGVDYITKPLHAEEILVRVKTQLALQDLQHQLQQANRQLAQRLEEVEVRNRDLDSFAHTVAHDLRTPINVILGYTDLLLGSRDALTEEDVQRSLEAIAEAAGKMSNITEELMLLAGVRTQEVDAVPLSMGEIVAEARQRLDYLFSAEAVDFQRPDEWPPVCGYAPWVEEVWVNYLSNAIKYGGACPTVVVGSEATENNHVRFWVQDNGPGLTPEEQARLFIPFERLGQVQTQGYGLGLSIVRRIITKLDGDVGVESELGEGSRFWFTLPRVRMEDSGSLNG